jgi:hypothetical protein
MSEGRSVMHPPPTSMHLAMTLEQSVHSCCDLGVLIARLSLCGHRGLVTRVHGEAHHDEEVTAILKMRCNPDARDAMADWLERIGKVMIVTLGLE